MILLRVGTDIVTYKGDQFQIIPTLQDPITQSEFEEHGIEPDVLNGITEEEWASFKRDFNAQTFTVIVFTTYEDEPELSFSLRQHSDALLEFQGTIKREFPLHYGAQTHDIANLKLSFIPNYRQHSDALLEFQGTVKMELPLHYGAQAHDIANLKLSFEPFVAEQGYIVLRVGDAYYSLKNNTVTFLSEFEGTMDDFKRYGMTPEDVKAITQNTWRDFTVGHNAMNFKVVVFTTFEDDPELELTQVELKPVPVFKAILPTNVWEDNSVEFHIDADTNVPGYPIGSVYYEIYKLDNLIKQGMTPDVFVTTIEEDTDFILNIGDGYETFTVKYEDKDTLTVTRSFPFEGAEWELSGLGVEGGALTLETGANEGVATTNHAQIVTLGRKTISGVNVFGSTDVVEEVLVGSPMRLIGENLYEIEIPKGKQILIEVVT